MALSHERLLPGWTEVRVDSNLTSGKQFSYNSVFNTDLKEYQVGDEYEIPDRKMDPEKFPPPIDHDLYLQSEMKKKFGKRYSLVAFFFKFFSQCLFP